jgi:subtilase family serine protease
MMKLSDGSSPLNPPTPGGFITTTSAFQCGSGGGPSRLFSKPSYQSKIPGPARMTPDIAHLADAFTGFTVLETNFDASGNPIIGQQEVNIIAGTSLSCPLFSALWGIASQNAGYPLGLAAAKMYRMPKGAITDVLPVGNAQSSGDVMGTINSSSGSLPESIYTLAAPETSASFMSTLFSNPLDNYSWYVLTFGTDSSLGVSEGWDPVTGLGFPNSEAFVDAAARP